MRHPKIGATTAAAVMLLAGAAQANTFFYEATLRDLSGLGGSAAARLTHDTDAGTLRVDVRAKGFEPNMLHIQHIHGPFDAEGNPSDAVTPGLEDDADGDGVVELLEGLPKYGPILLNLIDEDDTGNGFDGFPVATAPNGSFSFTNTYDLATTTAFAEGIEPEDLLPLEFREMVIHGAFLEPGVGGVGNEGPGDEIFDLGGYSAFVPVASGEIVSVDAPAPIPLPAAGWLMIAGLSGLGLMRRRRRA